MIMRKGRESAKHGGNRSPTWEIESRYAPFDMLSTGMSHWCFVAGDVVFKYLSSNWKSTGRLPVPSAKLPFIHVATAAILMVGLVGRAAHPLKHE